VGEDRDWWTQVTRGAAADPTAWRASARRLHESAELLWRRFAARSGAKWQDDWGDLPGALMLAGFALENLAKGLIIAREPERVRRDHLQKWSKGAGHELGDLLRGAGVDVAAGGEALTIERLEYHARWAGRYPVPMWFPENAPLDSLGHRPLEISDDKRAAEWKIYRGVFARAELLYREL
jgi:hypothetical protein